MNARKATVLGAIAVAILLAGTVVSIVLAIRGGVGTTGSTPVEPAVPASAGGPSVDGPPAPPSGVIPELPVPAAPLRDPSPRFTPSAERRLPRGSPAPVDLLTSLAEARTRILGCAGIHADRPGPSQPGQAPSRWTHGMEGRTVMLLDVLPGDGDVLVTRAVVQSRGDASDRLLDCARNELVGQVLPASAAHQGRAFQMQLPLDPPGR